MGDSPRPLSSAQFIVGMTFGPMIAWTPVASSYVEGFSHRRR